MNDSTDTKETKMKNYQIKRDEALELLHDAIEAGNEDDAKIFFDCVLAYNRKLKAEKES
jgi:hypothetical protein